MMNRHALRLLAHAAPGDPLEGPGRQLTRAEQEAADQIVATCSRWLRSQHGAIVCLAAQTVVEWQASPDSFPLRDVYRALGDCLMPMADRRRLLFPDRPCKSSLN